MKYLKKFDTETEYNTYMNDSPVLPNVSLIGGNTVHYNPVEPIHLFEVWANEECTVRPIVGNTYETLYLQINATLQGDKYYLYERYLQVFMYDMEPGDASPYFILYVDFRCNTEDYGYIGVDVLDLGAYACTCVGGVSFQANWPVSFGEVVG